MPESESRFIFHFLIFKILKIRRDMDSGKILAAQTYKGRGCYYSDSQGMKRLIPESRVFEPIYGLDEKPLGQPNSMATPWAYP